MIEKVKLVSDIESPILPNYTRVELRPFLNKKRGSRRDTYSAKYAEKPLIYSFYKGYIFSLSALKCIHNTKIQIISANKKKLNRKKWMTIFVMK